MYSRSATLAQHPTSDEEAGALKCFYRQQRHTHAACDLLPASEGGLELAYLQKSLALARGAG